MSNWTTTSKTNRDLDGFMEMDGGKVLSYTSTDLGVSDDNPTMLGGDDLHFKVEFTTVTGKSTAPTKTTFTIKAKKVAGEDKYEGSSTEDPDEAADDWTATETGPEPEAY